MAKKLIELVYKDSNNDWFILCEKQRSSYEVWWYFAARFWSKVSCAAVCVKVGMYEAAILSLLSCAIVNKQVCRRAIHENALSWYCFELPISFTRVYGAIPDPELCQWQYCYKTSLASCQGVTVQKEPSENGCWVPIEFCAWQMGMTTTAKVMVELCSWGWRFGDPASAGVCLAITMAVMLVLRASVTVV